jgi:RNA polymerase sigma factor (sigma-70 family)
MPGLQDDFSCLMQQVRGGSEDAAWELVNRFGESIRRAVRRALSEKLRSKFDSLDFVQLVWGSLFRVRDRLDQFERPEQFAAYLVAMARNKVGMEVRRRMVAAKRDVAREQSLSQLPALGQSQLVSRQPPPDEVAIARERWNHLVQNQPRHYRKIILLRLQGHTYQSIAEIVQVDECTVRRFLKKLLRDNVT